MITRTDLYCVFGRALAHTVGYTKGQAKAIACAWQMRRLDPKRREAHDGPFLFAGHRFVVYERNRQPTEFDDALTETGYGAFGPPSWPGSYDAVQQRIGAAHDGLLQSSMAVLERHPIELLDQTILGARVLQDVLRRTSINPIGFRHCSLATITRAFALEASP
jgi:hypothetical protein